MKTYLSILLVILLCTTSCEIYPRNTKSDCRQQCKGSRKSKACYEFCNCIHEKGNSLDECLEVYNSAAEDAPKSK